jgi:hypothetical protein
MSARRGHREGGEAPFMISVKEQQGDVGYSRCHIERFRSGALEALGRHS